MGWMTQARQKTGADQPPKGGGRYLSNEIISSKEAVFGITGVEYDGENAYQGQPRPRWLLDIVPWYEGEQLPIEDEKGRIGGTDGGRIYVSSRAGIDELMETLQDRLEDMPDDQRIEGPAVLVRRRHPNGKARYYDICEWDEAAGQPILDDGGDEMVPADEEPRSRPSGRPAASRSTGAARPSARRAAPAQEPEDEDEREDEDEARPPARSRPTGSSRPASAARSRQVAEPAAAERPSFDAARGAESDGPEAVPARAQQEDAGVGPAFSLHSGDLQVVNDALGIPEGHPDRYTSAVELAEEYIDEAEFPPIKDWLRDHGVPEKRKGEKGPGIPPGRGRIDDSYRNAYALALRCWEELVAADDGALTGPTGIGAEPGDADYHSETVVQRRAAVAWLLPHVVSDDDEPADEDDEELDPRGDVAVRTSPNPAVRSGAVVPTGQRPPSSSVPAPGIAARTRMRQAEVPENAGHQRDARRPADQAAHEATAAAKAAWMPPDQRERGGAQPAQQQDYSPGDEGRSLEPCPGGCGPNGVGERVTGRAMPNGSGGFVIMHQCPADHIPRPLQAELTGRKV